MFLLKLANSFNLCLLFPKKVLCLEGSSGIVGNGRTQSSLVFGNLRQSLRILGSLRKSSAIIRNCLNMAKNLA